MIIGIDASRANKKEKTGTEWYSYHVIEEIKKIADPNDQFILYTKKPIQGTLKNLPNNFQNKILKWPPKFLWTQIRLSIEMFINPPDVLFVSAHTIPLIHPKKTITTLHDIGFEKFPELYSSSRIGYKNTIWKVIIGFVVKIITLGRYSNTELDYHRWSARFAVKHAKKIITVSNFSKQEIIKAYKANSEDVEVVYSGYEKNSYRVIEDAQSINATLNKFNIAKPYFLYIGRLENKKNIVRLVESFGIFKKDSVNDYKLVLVGNQGFGFDDVKQKIQEYNLIDSIIFPGWISDNELPNLINGAEIFVFPSLYEGFGIPILEAMACGTPVITSNITAMPEIAKNAAMLINPYNAKEIAYALNKIITDDLYKQSIISRGLSHVKSFSWSNCASKTYRIIRDL